MKIGKIVFGTILGAFLAKQLYAGNPADLTSNHRVCPVNFYKTCVRKNSSNWLLGLMPFGKNKQYSIAGMGLQTPSGGKLLDLIACNNTKLGNGISLDTAIEVSRFDNNDPEGPAKGFNPTYGLSIKTGIGKIEPSYNPKTNSSELRASKGFKTGYGTFTPELRLHGSDKIDAYGIAVGFVPK